MIWIISYPNKYALFEPHYKLPFLSWLPQGFADKYIRITGKAKNFDCQPPSRKQLGAMLKETDLREEEVTKDILIYVVNNELEGSKKRKHLVGTGRR